MSIPDRNRNLGMTAEPILDEQGWSCSSCGNRKMLVGDTICNACGAAFQTPIKVHRSNLPSVPHEGHPIGLKITFGFCAVCCGAVIWILIGQGIHGQLSLPDGLNGLFQGPNEKRMRRKIDRYGETLSESYKEKAIQIARNCD